MECSLFRVKDNLFSTKAKNSLKGLTAMDSSSSSSGRQSGSCLVHTSSTTCDTATTTSRDREEAHCLAKHMHLLRKRRSQHELLEVTTTPIFTMPVLKYSEKLLSQGAPEAFPQYGLLGGLVDVLQNKERSILESDLHNSQDPRIFFNVATPSSTFICGSQGSGKSHTLSCLLENCLSRSDAGQLPKPVTGIVFHYDTFISDDGGSPCEAAFLSSNQQIQVRVLCSPTNIRTIKVSTSIALVDGF